LKTAGENALFQFVIITSAAIPDIPYTNTSIITDTVHMFCGQNPLDSHNSSSYTPAVKNNSLSALFE